MQYLVVHNFTSDRFYAMGEITEIPEAYLEEILGLGLITPHEGPKNPSEVDPPEEPPTPDLGDPPQVKKKRGE